MRSATERLAAVDEANLVLDHVGQVNVFLIAGLLAPGGFVGADGRPDLTALRTCSRRGSPRSRRCDACPWRTVGGTDGSR